MQKIEPALNQLAEMNPRLNIISSYRTTIEASFQGQRPQLKLINYGTGSGKTHQLFQAMCEAIESHPNTQIIGVYVAPLREHLQPPNAVKNRYAHIPFYKLNSLELLTTDTLLADYKVWSAVILKDQHFWSVEGKECPSETVRAAQKALRSVKDVIRRLKYVTKTDFGDEQFNEREKLKAQRELTKLIDDFLVFVVKYKQDESAWSTECLRLMELFFPLHLLRKKSGIVMLTYDKFEVDIPYFRHNGKTWVRKESHLDQYIVQHSDDSVKFILALDEQEDGYRIMLQHKIDIISPEALAINNALSSIYREFSALFSTHSRENRAFLHFIARNPRAFQEFEEHFEIDKPLQDPLQELAQVYRRLTAEEGNSFNFVNQLAKINTGLEKSLAEIVDVFEVYDEDNLLTLDFDMLRRVFSRFENNRSLLIPHELYSRLGNDLMSIFSYNNLYIYNIEPLKTLYLASPSGGHARIVEYEEAGSPSVAELIYAILAVRLQIDSIRDSLEKVLDAEDSQSRSLEVWSSQIARAQRASAEGVVQNRPTRYLSRDYVYDSYKSVINIMEISRYQHPDNNLVYRPLREVSIGSTAIMTSPEHKITSVLQGNANVVFLISATGGVRGDLSTSYDMNYLEDKLRDECGNSSFSIMNTQEIELSEQIREYRRSRRHVTVHFFDEELGSYPNEATKKVIGRFEKMVIRPFLQMLTDEGRSSPLSIYKVRELHNFARFLFYLFEDDSLQAMLAFTQTLRWVERLIWYCAQYPRRDFVVKASSEHPNVYYVQVRHRDYHSNVCVKLILYQAAFNEMYHDKSTQKTYLDELEEEKNQKILFISAYQSASKGLNPTVRTQGGGDKDFDSLVLLMDSYYTVMGPTLRGSRGRQGRKGRVTKSLDLTTLYHFSLMKSIVYLGDSNLEIKDFNSYLTQPEAEQFRQRQHQILLGKGILQAIGRTERRDFPNQVVKIFINEETRRNLASFFRYLEREDPDETRKLSVNNYEVYLRVQEEEQKRTIQRYDEHVFSEIDATIAFQDFRRKMLAQIQSFHANSEASGITQTWELLRDPLVFSSPEEYLDKLRKSGLFPETFIESLFYNNPDQLGFAPHLTWVEENGKKLQIITDSLHSERVYTYQDRLYPEYLKTNRGGYDLEGNEVSSLDPSTDAICRLYDDLLPHSEIFNHYIPRPPFFYDVFYPSLSENFTERWIREVIFGGRDWSLIKSMFGFQRLLDFQAYSQLYERFDLYYIRGRTLLCIDVKAWSHASGSRLSKETLDKTSDKLEMIRSEYPKAFDEVRGLLLNLYAPQQKNQRFSPALFSGSLIYLDNHCFPVASTILRDFLFDKER